MAEHVTLNPDGPHSADYTKEVADALRESVRVLNHATRNKAGLEYPADAAAVIGALAAAAGGLEQTCHQISRWLSDEYEGGRMAEWSEGRHGGDVSAAITDAQVALDHAITGARILAGHLNEAHQATSGLQARSED
jgi:hypothetical protein